MIKPILLVLLLSFTALASVGKSKSNTGALGSSHNSIGVSIRYMF